MIGAITGGRVLMGAGVNSGVGERDEASRGPSTWVKGTPIADLRASQTPREMVPKVCSGAKSGGGEEWFMPLADAMGGLCDAS